MTYPKKPIKPSDIYVVKPDFEKIGRDWEFEDFRPREEEDEAFIAVGGVVLRNEQGNTDYNNHRQPRIILRRRDKQFEDIWE